MKIQYYAVYFYVTILSPCPHLTNIFSYFFSYILESYSNQFCAINKFASCTRPILHFISEALKNSLTLVFKPALDPYHSYVSCPTVNYSECLQDPVPNNCLMIRSILSIERQQFTKYRTVRSSNVSLAVVTLNKPMLTSIAALFPRYGRYFQDS